MKLDQLKKNYLNSKIQYVIVDKLGAVLESDNTIFEISKQANLASVDPFFESIITLLTSREAFQIACVNLSIGGANEIVDVKFLPQDTNENQWLILIEKLTEHYKNYQLLAQLKNTTIINHQLLTLKNQNLTERDIFKNVFIDNFNHQLRNPLTTITTFCDMLAHTELNSAQQNFFNLIQNAAKQVQSKIDDVLDFAILQSGKFIFKDTVFDLNASLQQIITAYKALTKEKNLKFSVEIDDDLPDFVFADQFRFEQILTNLLNNAITHTAVGKITLKVSLNFVRAQKVNIRVEVIDTGVGIDPTKLDLVMERFTKLNTNTTTNGYGLGLPIVKTLMQQMDGSINLQSKLNHGTTVTCDFNLKRNPLISDIEANKVVEVKNAKKPNGKKSILLIEESEEIQILVLKLLAQQGNFYVEILPSTDNLLETLETNDFDLLLFSEQINNQNILDNDLIKSKKIKVMPKIILASGINDTKLKKFQKAAVDDVISKPFTPETFLNTVFKNLI